MDNAGCNWIPQPSATPASRPVRQPRTDLDGRNLATDQKVGGSSPSERAQVTGPFPHQRGANQGPTTTETNTATAAANPARPAVPGPSR